MYLMDSNSNNKVQVPYALLKPLAKGVKLRKSLYLKRQNLTPLQVQKIIREATANSLTPIVIDLETTSACAHDRTQKVAAVSLASSHSVVSINVKDKHDVWISILNYLYATQLPLMAHNAVFDMAWMLRDFNPHAKYYSEYKLFNFVGCTYGMYRHLASEGFNGQKWGLDYAQKTLLNIESNKVERNKRLVEQGLVKKNIKKETLIKLLGSEEAANEYTSKYIVREQQDDEEEVEDNE
jgi:hypothetical protein